MAYQSALALRLGPICPLGKQRCWLARSYASRGMKAAQRRGGGQRAGAGVRRGDARELRTGRDGEGREGKCGVAALPGATASHMRTVSSKLGPKSRRRNPSKPMQRIGHERQGAEAVSV